MTESANHSSTIALIGAGNLATHLALALVGAGHQIVGICSRSGSSAQRLLDRLGQGGVATSQVADLPTADFYLIAAKDDAIAQVAAEWPSDKRTGILAHTSGGVPIDALHSAGAPYGVLYPLQTFSKDRAVDFQAIPCFVEGANEEIAQQLQQLAQSISQQVQFLDSERRRVLHLSAVMACNFVNHLYDLAGQQLAQHGLSPSLLQPLIKETADKIKNLSPREAQTGPAIRGDQRVLDAHRALLAQQPLTLQLYNLMSESIFQTFHP